MVRGRRFLVTVFALFLVGGLLLPVAEPLRLNIGRDVWRAGKGVLIYVLVKRFADELNGVIHKLIFQKNAELKEATKVVPVVSVGRGIYVGAAQVVGPEEAIKKVKAVAQVEAKYQWRWRMHVYLPVSTERPKGKVDKWVVKGVGVSALIDVKL